MIFERIKSEITFEVKCEVVSNNHIQTGIGVLKYTRDYEIFLEKTLYKIKILDKAVLEDINYYLNIKNALALIVVKNVVGPKHFIMEIIFVSYPVQYIHDTFYIDVSEKIYKSAKKINFIKNTHSMEDFKSILKKKALFFINGEQYILISRGNSSLKEVNYEKINKLNNAIKKFEKQYTKTNDKKFLKYIKNCEFELTKVYEVNLAFTLFLEDFMVPVKKRLQEDKKYSFEATKLVSVKNEIKKNSLILLKVDNLEFTGKPLSKIIESNLGDILESDNSFLKKWDEFAKLEGEKLLNRVLSIGEIKIKRWERTQKGYKLNIEADIEEGDYLCAVDETPDFIKKNFNWEEYQNYLNTVEPFNRRKDIGTVFEVIKRVDNIIEVKTEENIDFDNKKVFLSIYSDSIQIERRLEAREKIKSGNSANPFLGLIIEDSDKLHKLYNPKIKHKIEPLSENVLNKIFEYKPTLNQQKAIEIALNTPDIAIIQGPPGTGKTTVITAILERLNELSAKSKDFAGEVLVTGIQHDAVENIRSRIRINGLPTPKFGKKSGDDNFFDIKNMEKFAKDLAKKAQINIPEYKNIVKIKQIEEQFLIYLKNPSKKFAVEMLNNTLKMNLDFELVKKIKEKIKKLQTNEKSIDLSLVYSLRITKEGFLDDGYERNKEVLVKFNNILTENEKKLLQTNPQNLDDYLKNLRKLKSSLLSRLTPPLRLDVEKKDKEIIELINEIKKTLKSSKKDKIADILSDYVLELKNNPFAMKKIAEDYSFVYSATTQQSMGREIKEKKEKLVYDTVIVDEAARVSPMDLLIVMSQAKKRIILVGDDRQLPHLVDETIIKETALEEDAFIKDSMFAYLKQRVKNLKKYDGIERFITLDRQYRTHPLLGKFISDNFYAKYDEGFESPLGEDKFTHSINDLKNTPAVWIDVKNSECKEERAWSRECEAKKIIEYLNKWLKEDESLNFGIITFYRKQVEAIENMLKDMEDYQKFKERIKVGTVDSFQGMEFDVVFLSVVRSKDLNLISENLENYKLFGFLISKNRLCVSMSRQKKALIVVGDKDYYDSKYAKMYVTELYNFLQLCKEKGKIL